MKYMNLRYMAGVILSAALMASLTGCHNDIPKPSEKEIPGIDGEGDSGIDDGSAPDFVTEMPPYTGQLADDAHNDAPGTNADLYWEAGTYTSKVYVRYDSTTASVTTSVPGIIYYTDGAYVTVDMLTNSVKNVEIVVSGSTTDGQLKIYGNKKHKLTLDGVTIVSLKGPAINDQCKKRVFVHLADGTVNKLADASEYDNDPRYLGDGTPETEDRKGCFFAEGTMLYSGTGLLVVEGRQRHGIATDGYMFMRPGVTIAVTDAVKNALHIKGNLTDEEGLHMLGGLLYARSSGEAGRAVKTDQHVKLRGGCTLLGASGEPAYDVESADLSSGAAIKADGNVYITGGTHTLYCTGSGAKGINATAGISVSGGYTTITSVGGPYTYPADSKLTALPTGMKSDGAITVSGGNLNLLAITADSDTSLDTRAIDSKSILNVSGGYIYAYATDAALTATSGIEIEGGKVYAYSVSGTPVVSGADVTISGGVVIAIGAKTPATGLSFGESGHLYANGGMLMAVAGSPLSLDNANGSQYAGLYSVEKAAKDSLVSIVNSDNVVASLVMPRTLAPAEVLFSSPALTETAFVSYGGVLTAAGESWNGFTTGGKLQ